MICFVQRPVIASEQFQPWEESLIQPMFAALRPLYGKEQIASRGFSANLNERAQGDVKLYLALGRGLLNRDNMFCDPSSPGYTLSLFLIKCQYCLQNVQKSLTTNKNKNRVKTLLTFVKKKFL